MRPATLNRCWWAYLAVLVHRLGGVSGATRRIVLHWPGEFTAAQVRRSLGLLYPGLHPNEHQVEDCIENLVFCRRIKCVGEDAQGKIYRVAEPTESACVLQPSPQLTFCL
jgi:hypothetical protein